MSENVTTSNPASIHRPPSGGYAHVAVTKPGPRIIKIAGQVGYTVAGTISEELISKSANHLRTSKLHLSRLVQLPET
jgi:hypothetical protein